MKISFPLAAICCLFLACSKDNKSASAYVKFDITTENKLITHYELNAGECTINDGSGNWIGHRIWNIVFVDTALQISLAFPGDFPDDNVTLDSTLSFSHRKGRVGADFWANYGEGNTLTHIGSDSAFLNIKITMYDGHFVSGSFDFKTYDPGQHAFLSNGSFVNIPVNKK